MHSLSHVWLHLAVYDDTANGKPFLYFTLHCINLMKMFFILNMADGMIIMDLRAWILIMMIMVI